jgi:mono/diheme cytochrome c family protein
MSAEKSFRTVALTVLVTLLVIVLLLATFVYSGMYDVSAIRPHSRLTTLMLRTVSDRSIAQHAGTATAPAMDQDALLEGAEHFHEMCVVCHGAPGVAKGEIAEGLNPRAPELSRHAAGEMSDAQLFWVIRNGIRFSGMPGFQSSHTDEQIWQIAKFVKTMDHMTDAQNESVIRAVKKANGDTLAAPRMHMH